MKPADLISCSTSVVAIVVIATILNSSNASQECKVSYSGSEYTGLTSVTRTGRKCQAWASQHPHHHNYTDPRLFPDWTLDGAADHCRSPEAALNALGPWCYTTDAEVRWQYCDIPYCSAHSDCRRTELGTEYRGERSVTISGKQCRKWPGQNPNNYCRNPDGRPGGPYCYIEGATDETTEVCDIPFCKPPMHCKRSQSGVEYTGRVSRTQSGGICQRWDGQYPHPHNDTNPDRFPDSTLGDAANYCRNPDKSSEGPWCYTTHPKRRREYCIVDLCQDCLVSDTGREYSGSRSLTRSGFACQRWDQQTPHAHNMTDPSRFPDVNLSSAENYCRNPDNDPAGPWCLTSDPDVQREPCDLKPCEARPADRVHPALARHVIHIGVDGLRPDALVEPEGAAPNIWRRLAGRGAYTLTRARTVLQTSSSPAWSAALCGLDLETSGITNNGWLPPWRGHLQPITPVTGNDVPLPCTFQEIKAQDPSMRTAMFYDWLWLTNMASRGFPGALDKEAFCPVPVIPCDEIIAHAARKYLKDVFESAEKSYTFLYLGNVDEFGHTFGWGTLLYRWAVRQIDRQVASILDVISEQGMENETLVVLHSDHGGEGKSHGRQQDSDLLIPMILRGPGIRDQGHELDMDVSITDVAPTVMYTLGLRPNPHWTGQVMRDAFRGSDPTLTGRVKL